MDSREELMDGLKKHLKLDIFQYSNKEIDLVQQFFEKHFEEPAHINMNSKELNDTCGAYFGTAFLWHFGGKWQMNSDKSHDDFGLPQIVEYRGKGFIWIPFTPFDWLYFIESEQLDERIVAMFRRWHNYHANHPEYKLTPVRNYQ